MSSRLLDVCYFLSPLIVAIVTLAALHQLVCRRKVQRVLWVVSAIFATGSVALMKNRESRYAILSDFLPSSTDQLRRRLGNPERLVKFTEGDELWTYSVRSFPWTKMRWYSVYKGAVLAASTGEKIGLFETEPSYVRDPKESELVIRQLSRMSNAK